MMTYTRRDGSACDEREAVDPAGFLRDGYRLAGTILLRDGAVLDAAARRDAAYADMVDGLTGGQYSRDQQRARERQAYFDAQPAKVLTDGERRVAAAYADMCDDLARARQ